MSDDAGAIMLAEDAVGDEERATEEATVSLITFRLGSEWYALPLAAVREVVRGAQITYLPSAPAAVAGILNLRGNIVAAVDPQRVLGLPASARGEHSRVILLAAQGVEAGVVVDEVGSVAAVPVSQMEPPLTTLEGAAAAAIAQTCRWDGRLVAVLKTESFVGGNAAGQGA